jgi:uncharacterized membrane protein
MLSSLKPNKTNVLGTILLLAANYAGGFVSRIASGALIQRAASGATQYAGAAGRGAMAGAGGYGGAGLVSEAMGLVVLAVLFYAILSLVPVMFAKSQESREEKGEAGKATRGDKK